MTEQAYMSKENYDRLTLLEPRTLSEEEKQEMYAYTVFNMIANIALAKQRGSEIEKNGMAKQLLTLPNQILKFIADSMIEKMKPKPPIDVHVSWNEKFRNAFTGMGKKFFAKNPHLISILRMTFHILETPEKPNTIMSYFVTECFTPKESLNTIKVQITMSPEYDEQDYKSHKIAIKNFLMDIIREKNLEVDKIVFEYFKRIA